MQRRTKVDNNNNVACSIPPEDRNDDEEVASPLEEKNNGKPYSTKDKSSSSSISKRSACLACVLLITIKKCIKLSILFIGVTLAAKFINNSDDATSTNTQTSTNTIPSSYSMDKNIPSINVDGQKKLRLKMLALRARQEKGLDLGVKIRSRWVGDKAQYWGNDLDLKKDVSVPPVGDPDAKESSKNQQEEKQVSEIHSPSKDFQPNSIQEGGDLPPDPVHQGEEIQLIPKSGSHTSTNNAVFGFAQGYSLDIYESFLESLSDTGYTGDVVLSVSADVSQETLEYLASMSNVIVYKDEWDCVDGDMNAVSNPGSGSYHCKVTGLYYDKDSKAVEDHREYRPVATARYELYYAWSTKYSPNSWILLIDFRDTYFQLNPFENLTSTTPPALLLFEENRESVDLGRSSFNSRWLKTAYGRDTEKKFSSYPVICSGSSIGSNQYIQIYLRGMIQEYDNTHCILKGCDQGFHNYLYYSSKLSNWIPTIQVYEQGKGLINNLAALRNKPLKEWGILSEGKVLNWDKSLSAVAHQVDRDDELKVLNRARKKELLKRWEKRKSL